METERLVDELHEARDAFFAALAAVAPESMTTPGLLGEWSARDLIAHLGYWSGHATEVIHAVEEGRTHEIGAGDPPTDTVNETVVRIARQTPLATVRKREGASVEALVDRLRSVDPALLGERLPNGATLEAAIREDGAEHYREHADALRNALEGPVRG